MPSRVSPAQVKQILPTDMSDNDLQSFIATADTMIDSYLLNKDLPDALLVEISKYLSAHFASMRERQEVEVELGAGKVKYAGSFGRGLEFTQYGQTVLLLDTSGTLADVGNSKAAFDILEFAGTEDT